MHQPVFPKTTSDIDWSNFARKYKESLAESKKAERICASCKEPIYVNNEAHLQINRFDRVHIKASCMKEPFKQFTKLDFLRSE